MFDLMNTQMGWGVILSLACMMIYFSAPGLYYSGLGKTLLFLVGFYACVLALSADVGVGFMWVAFIIMFFLYANHSRWYKTSVLKRTYREWREHLKKQGALDPAAEDDGSRNEEKILEHVAESWNPKWKEDKLKELAGGCQGIDELIERIHQGEWRPARKSSPKK